MKYIDWIKTLPCAVCEDDTRTDPHHLIGDGAGMMGGKSPDELLMPLCRKHHNQVHAMTNQVWINHYGYTQADLLARTIRMAVYQGWRITHVT